jgi:hypothetical protein
VVQEFGLRTRAGSLAVWWMQFGCVSILLSAGTIHHGTSGLWVRSSMFSLVRVLLLVGDE